MKRLRKKLIHWLFDASMVLYCKFKKKTPWGITTSDLLEMPKTTFGYQLGVFLKKNGFELIPKVERHDAYHVVAGFGTRVEEEIALQYVCFANGKRTPYLFAVLFLGTLILPDYHKLYIRAYRYGKEANTFHHFDYKTILPLDFKTFQGSMFKNPFHYVPEE
ncbi:MAG: hypothetical protein R3359_08915 [Marinirhabdus sp.]|nr:hypothetical protein [Marinirhabdus sp.]